MQPVSPTELMPVPEGDAALRFDSAFLGQIAAGFDFLKIDDQAETIEHYHVPAIRSPRLCQEAKETVSRKWFQGLINCMAENSLCVFNTRYSVVTRCSRDYRAGDAVLARSHLLQSFHNMLWMGQTVWGITTCSIRRTSSPGE